MLHDELEREIANSVEGSFYLWKDTYNIPLGSDFPKDLLDALERATIFMPIVTPAWRRSEWCQREYNIFLGFMESQARRRLILPIYWRDINELSSNSVTHEDEVIRNLRHTNFSRWQSPLENGKCLREIFQFRRANAEETRREINRVAESVTRFLKGTAPSQLRHPIRPVQAAPRPVQAGRPLSGDRVRSYSYPPSKRLEAPASVEVSTGGNYLCTAEHFELGIVAAFEPCMVETQHYKFILAASSARVQVDSLGASVDPQSCTKDFKDGSADIRYRQRREWEIRSKDGRGLDGEFLKEGALCSLLCHEPVALARASVVAKNHEILVIPGTLVKNRKLDIIHPNPKKLIELWLKEKMAAHCNSALSEIILHEFEVRTTLEE